MKIGRTLYVETRKEWRSWLASHHDSYDEIWVIFYKKNSGRPRLPYNDAVEEALCYGWIDSIVKPIDGQCYAQRFSPRRPKSLLSASNRERIRRLMKAKKMTRAGLRAIEHHLRPRAPGSSARLQLASSRFPSDIIAAIKAEPLAWKHFQRFPLSYKRIRIGFIEGSRNRPAFFEKRLTYFIRMTAKNKMFGMVR